MQANKEPNFHEQIAASVHGKTEKRPSLLQHWAAKRKD